MQLTSPAFTDGARIPLEYTCDGAGISPPLEITDVPSGTQSLVLIMEDPDVPRSIRPDGMWDHWLIWNIDPSTASITEGQEPDGVHGTGTGGKQQYGGPCPPDKEHRYLFKLYALDTQLTLPPGSSKAELVQAMEGHVTDRAELLSRYQRQAT